MANAKRQRQDEARQIKRQAEEAAAKKTAQRRRLQRIGIIGGLAVAAVVILTLLTRGGSDSTDVASSASSTMVKAPVVTASPQLKSKPVVTVPAGDPPKELQVKDLVVGTGDTIVAGDTVTVQYTGVSWSTKEQFDSSWDNGGTPFPVTNIGTPDAPVIKGWSEGLLGAKVGSRRQLVIPPDLAYGNQATGSIKANETLVFVVDIISTTHVAGSAAPTSTTAG